MNTPMIDTPESHTVDRDYPDRKWLFPKYWYFDLLLILVIIIGGYFRLVGIRWDESQHLHPDERFLTMVETDISPVNSISEYFNTEFSSLNPHNRGHGFYVYGDLPIIFVRYLAEWTGQTGYDQVNVLGRQVSAIFDLFTLLLVYLIGSKLYDKRVGFLASIFFAFSVMQIQISHYFAVDTFLCFFTTLAVYFAVLVYSNHISSMNKLDGQDKPAINIFETFYTRWSGIGYWSCTRVGDVIKNQRCTGCHLAACCRLALVCQITQRRKKILDCSSSTEFYAGSDCCFYRFQDLPTLRL
jgi:hypothetical protein